MTILVLTPEIALHEEPANRQVFECIFSVVLSSSNKCASAGSGTFDNTSSIRTIIAQFGASPFIGGISPIASFCSASPSTLNFVQPFISTAPSER